MKANSKKLSAGEVKPAAGLKSPAGVECVSAVKITKLKKLHDEFEKSSLKSLDRAFEMGEILTGIKESLAHGKWEKWHEENVPQISIRSAQDYLKLWKYRDSLKNASGAFLVHGYGEALAEVSKIARKERAEKKGATRATEEIVVLGAEERKERRDLLRKLGDAFLAGMETENTAVIKVLLGSVPHWRPGILEEARQIAETSSVEASSTVKDPVLFEKAA